MDVRNRIIGAYVAWGVAALATTLQWADVGGTSVNGQTAGLNGGLVMVLSLAAAALIAWWDRGSRWDAGRIRMAFFVAIAILAVLARNAYNIAAGPYSRPGVSVGYGLWLAIVAGVAGTVLTRSLMTR